MEKSGTRYFEYFDPETGIRYPFRCAFEDYETKIAEIKLEAAKAQRKPSESKYKTRKFKGKFKDGHPEKGGPPE